MFEGTSFCQNSRIIPKNNTQGYLSKHVSPRSRRRETIRLKERCKNAEGFEEDSDYGIYKFNKDLGRMITYEDLRSLLGNIKTPM